MTIAGLTLTAAAMLAGSAQGPTTPQPRQPGEVFHLCSATHEMPMLRFAGRQPRMAVRRRGRVEERDWPANGRERFGGSVEVDADGTLRNLSMHWHTDGFTGWPQVWRADLHPVQRSGHLDRPWLAPGTRGLFDPGELDIKLDFLSERRLGGLWAFQLRPARHRYGQPTLLLLARIPNWRRSAEVRLRWTMIEQLADGQPRLAWTVAPATWWNERTPSGIPQSGEFDLSVMPAVLDGFRAVQARLLEMIDRAPERCAREVEPEPNPEAEI